MMRYTIIWLALIFYAYTGVCQNKELIKFKPGVYFNDEDAVVKQLNNRTDTSDFYGIDDSEFCIQFPGGDKALRKYLKKNIKIPKDSVTSIIEGKIMVSFTVNEKGKVENARIEKGIYDPIDKTILKVVSGMPDWIWNCDEAPWHKITTKRYIPVSIIQDKKKKNKIPTAKKRHQRYERI